MNSVFSVDEIGESFWPEQLSATAMNNHCQSEWSYDRLLQDVPSAVISPTSSANCNRIGPSMSSNSSSKRAEGDKNEISEPLLDPTFLKTQLDRACAAVARSRDLPNKPGESSSLPESQLQATKPLKLGSKADGSGHVVSSTVQCGSDGGPISVPALSSVQKNSGVQVKQTTSESSREDSEDEELEGDTGTTENLDPAEVKRVRRMQSNRESARRSRRRKQEHMSELETQVGQLKVEHTSLLKRLTDINQKYDNASVDNRILKADIETLRTKVKMAEETVKRVTGINPLLLAMSNLQGPSMPFMGNTMDSFASGAMPVQQPDTNHQFFHHSAPHMTGMNSRTDGTFPGVGNLQQNCDGGTNSVPSIPEWGGSGHKQ